MPGDEEDFWPRIEDVEDVTSPIVILRKHAAPLWDKSGHLINAEVQTRAGSDGTFVHTFNLTVPALEGYTYELFEVRHGIESYPVWQLDEYRRRTEFAGEDEFTAWIKSVLSSEKTKKVLSTLLQQARR